jgi:hypothetical protein
MSGKRHLRPRALPTYHESLLLVGILGQEASGGLQSNGDHRRL